MGENQKLWMIKLKKFLISKLRNHLTRRNGVKINTVTWVKLLSGQKIGIRHYKESILECLRKRMLEMGQMLFLLDKKKCQRNHIRRQKKNLKSEKKQAENKQKREEKEKKYKERQEAIKIYKQEKARKYKMLSKKNRNGQPSLFF